MDEVNGLCQIEHGKHLQNGNGEADLKQKKMSEYRVSYLKWVKLIDYGK